jgi:TRAP-type uncharacterized transport system substrate-binding protein
MRQFLAATVAIFAGLIAVLWLAVTILKPGPVGRITLSSGGANGVYHEFAQTLAADLARFGITLELRPDLEGMASMKTLLSAADTGVQGGIVKGGILASLQGRYASEEDRKEHDQEAHALRSVGRLFVEPIWVFYRGPQQVRSLSEFKGKRILVGSAQSGARLVVTRLLKANGVDASNSTLVYEDLGEDAGALGANTVDVAFVIATAETPKIQKLLRLPNILLMNFAPDADAYTNRFPSLGKVVLHQGAVEFAPDLPSADITLLTTSAVLVVRADLHPALMLLLARAVQRNAKKSFDAAGDPVLFYEPGKYPNVQDPEYDVAADVRTLFRSGELPFLLRTLAPLAKSMGVNFWVPAFAHVNGSRMILLLIPLLSVLLPLTRILPSAYNWSIRRRLLYWYRQLKAIEATIVPNGGDDHVGEKLHELDRIDHAIQRIRVPLAFSDQLYDLRGHVNLVRQRLVQSTAPARRAAE